MVIPRRQDGGSGVGFACPGFSRLASWLTTDLMFCVYRTTFFFTKEFTILISQHPALQEQDVLSMSILELNSLLNSVVFFFGTTIISK